MTAPISNEPTTHGYTTMRDATSGRYVRGTSSAVLCHRILAGTLDQGASITSITPRP